MLMAELHGVARDRRIQETERLLDALGLAERKKQKARTLSKGLRQRLMLCAALVTGPKVLFLDEPTSGLDVQSTRLIWTNARLDSVDCTVVTIILCKRFDLLCFWAFRVLSGLAEPAYASPVYTGIFYHLLQIPQYVASKGIVRKILGMPNRALHLNAILLRFITAGELVLCQ